MTEDKDTTWARFHDAVNMTAGELEKWLATEESNAVGQKQGESESTGHASGRRIVEILTAKRKRPHRGRLRAHAQGCRYAKRHLAQRPQGNIDESPWRYSLMNWGHDPAKS